MPASGKRKIKSASTCFDRMSAKLKAFGDMASNGLSPVVAYGERHSIILPTIMTTCPNGGREDGMGSNWIGCENAPARNFKGGEVQFSLPPHFKNAAVDLSWKTEGNGQTARCTCGVTGYTQGRRVRRPFRVEAACQRFAKRSEMRRQSKRLPMTALTWSGRRFCQSR